MSEAEAATGIEDARAAAPFAGLIAVPGAAGAPVCEGDVCWIPGAEGTAAEAG